MFSWLRNLEGGELRIVQGDDQFRFGNSEQLRATIRVNDPSTYKKFFHGGDLGAARGYMKGAWETNDLLQVVRLFCRNRNMFVSTDSKPIWLLQSLKRLTKWFRKNTIRGSRKNIREHYDLSNDFFDQFLDDTLTYSSAWFKTGNETLEEAQKKKMDRLCEQLELGPDDHLLEIGTGWGGLSIRAAQQYGCDVTTTTISDEQYEYTKHRVAELGLSDQIRVLNDDYRRLTGGYDKLVSVEMIEAVGYDYLDSFFTI
ncbi:MAG: cyclopropane-fatty-acyl-phospholipid synthase family protein, partial [bacterium]